MMQIMSHRQMQTTMKLFQLKTKGLSWAGNQTYDSLITDREYLRMKMAAEWICKFKACQFLKDQEGPSTLKIKKATICNKWSKEA